MRKSMIESIRDFILTCPFLSDGRVQVDWNGIQPTEYSIDGTPVQRVVKEYIGGDSIRQYTFLFTSLEAYGTDVQQNIENSGFYEDFAQWLEEQSRIGHLPELGDRKEAQKIEAQSTGYLFDSGTDTARYQIQCRLVYFQEGGR